MTLTPRQRQVLEAIIAYRAAHGISPTIRELGAAVGVSSPNGIETHLKALERKGYVTRRASCARSLVPVEKCEGDKR